ncbi:hypothetical protein BKA69DRAFT_506325 [Paraphysoderma sedebokerense]|nr:hypothetical protein BKA69DRAFT_506325 [Paraphysoderma sedebokerense]
MSAEPYPEPWVLPPDAVPLNAIMILLSFIAAFANTVVFIQFYRFRRDLRPIHYPLISACLSDLLCGYLSLVFYTAHAIENELSFEWCQYSGIVLCWFLPTSGMSLGVLAVERYFGIVRHKTIPPRFVVASLIYSWVTSLAIGLYPIFTGLNHEVKPSRVYCSPNWKLTNLPLQVSFSIVCVVFVVFITLGITTSYYLIYKKAVSEGFKYNEKSFVLKKKSSEHNSSKRDPANSSISGNHLNPSDEARQKQFKLTLKLALITLSSYVAWTGTIVSIVYPMANDGKYVPAAWDYFLGVLNFCHSIFSPMIVLTLDSRWRIHIRSGIPFIKKSQQNV